AVVPRSGHTPNMENPADYDAALLRFLGSLT
ncbi:alpha/beta hydrolase, partial [Kocuria sp. HSID17582]